MPIPESNYLRRGLAFRDAVSSRLKRQTPDQIQFRTPWEGVAAVQSGIPTVYEVNGFPSVEMPISYPNATERAIGALEADEQLCLEGASRIICHSQKTKRYLERERKISPKKIHLIPNGYDPVMVGEREKEPGSPLKLVYLGTLSEWQGVLWSLPVFRKLAPGTVALDIYGPLHKRSIKELNRVIRKMKLQGVVRYCGVLPRYFATQTLAR
jgi:glycosyltransferase involved in cell wall biosynthesis